MSAKLCIAVVDNDRLARTLLANVLAEEYEVLVFDSGEALLAADPRVDAILLDMEMHGMSGLDLCQAYHQQEEHRSTPVIFVSAHAAPEERRAAFAASADDFIIKPIVADEVRHKVHSVLEQRERLRALADASDQARQAAFSAMASMSDLGVVLQFMREAAASGDYGALGELLRQSLQHLGLEGVISIQGGEANWEVATAGAQHPLQPGVMAVMRDMGRIFAMSSWGIVNYPRVSLLVQNLPMDDRERHGRILDLLAMVGESADARAAGIDLTHREARQREGAREALADLRRLLATLGNRLKAGRDGVAEGMEDVLRDIFRSLQAMGISPVQEAVIMDRIAEGKDECLALFDQAVDLGRHFAALSATLERLGAGNPDSPGLSPAPVAEMPALPQGGAITLF